MIWIKYKEWKASKEFYRLLDGLFWELLLYNRQGISQQISHTSKNYYTDLTKDSLIRYVINLYKVEPYEINIKLNLANFRDSELVGLVNALQEMSQYGYAEDVESYILSRKSAYGDGTVNEE